MKMTNKEAVKTLYPSAQVASADGVEHYVLSHPMTGKRISRYCDTPTKAWADARSQLGI